MSVVLIGPPAAGKSRIGKRLARALGLSYADSDKLVTRDHGPIGNIFANFGEGHFRGLERQAVLEALASASVVSLGGGAILDVDTRADLRNHTVVLVMASAEAVADRLASGKRPLSRSVSDWEELVHSRMPLYEQCADLTIDTSARPIDAAVADLIESLEERGWIRENRRQSGD